MGTSFRTGWKIVTEKNPVYMMIRKIISVSGKKSMKNWTEQGYKGILKGWMKG